MRRQSPPFWRDESGATMVEYGLLVGLIALVVALGADGAGAGHFDGVQQHRHLPNRHPDSRVAGSRATF